MAENVKKLCKKKIATKLILLLRVNNLNSLVKIKKYQTFENDLIFYKIMEI